MKYALTASPEMDRMLKTLADKQGVDTGEILRRAVILMDYLTSEENVGKELLLRDLATGEASRIVLMGSEGENSLLAGNHAAAPRRDATVAAGARPMVFREEPTGGPTGGSGVSRSNSGEAGEYGQQ
jgi:hypothetical protein